MSVRSLNKVTLIGNLTRDPVMRYTPNNTAVASFSVATNRSWTPADGGEKQERADFHNIVAWSKLAEVCGQLLHKGDKVYVEGRLQTREWKGKDGSDQRTTEIVLSDMILLNSRGGASSSAADMSDPSVTVSAPATPKKKGKKKDSAEDSDGVVPTEEVTEVEDISEDIPF